MVTKIENQKVVEKLKEELKEELKDVKEIYVVGITKGTNPNWGKGIWRTFRLYYLKDGKLRQLIIPNELADEVPHYNKKKRVFECNALGVDRVFLIVYGLGNYLFDNGYKFKDVFLSEIF